MGLKKQYLFDSNAISDYLSGLLDEKGRDFMDATDGIISVIVELEVLCWKSHDDEVVKQYLSTLTVLDISPLIKENCVRIRKSQKIKLPDAIIAATALTHDLTLVTGNATDFAGIKGLRILNLRELRIV